MFVIDKPDKYEKWMGITNVERRWAWNNRHQCWHQERNYDLENLEAIYTFGYRSEKFRGESIEDAFNRIKRLPYGESENKYRVDWFLRHFKRGKLLDIGAGIGVFAHEIRSHGWEVEASETNLYSIKFLTEKLKIPCCEPEDVSGKYDVISIIHVIEHIENTGEFLRYVKDRLHPNGSVFIEVPDAVEFNHLPQDSDEFNSCHVWFFDVPGLYRLVDRYFRVTDIHCVHHQARNRWRIMLRGEK